MRLPSLYQFFRHQVSHGFTRQGITESAIVDYVSEILTRFAETRRLYLLQDAAGRPLEYIVDMLDASRQSESETAIAVRRRYILRHVGEYALFMSGLFRERLRRRGELEYYLAHGSSAYWRCADCELNPRQRQVYWHLHHDFGKISGSLDTMRNEQLPLSPPTLENILGAFWRV